MKEKVKKKEGGVELRKKQGKKRKMKKRRGFVERREVLLGGVEVVPVTCGGVEKKVATTMRWWTWVASQQLRITVRM